MTTEKKSDDKTETTTDRVVTTKSAENKAVAARPTVPAVPLLWDARRKKRKRRYTQGMKSLQLAGFGVSKSSSRLANAVAQGLDRFYRGSRKSSRRKRDGLLRDLLKNSARGFRRASREFGKAPYDLSKRIDTRPLARFFLG